MRNSAVKVPTSMMFVVELFGRKVFDIPFMGPAGAGRRDLLVGYLTCVQPCGPRARRNSYSKQSPSI